MNFRFGQPDHIRVIKQTTMFSPHAFFQFVYTTLYTLLYVLLIALLLITPGDVIYRAYTNGQTANIWIVAVCYAMTLLVVSFIYATRLYINRGALSSIPRLWVPVEKGDGVHEAVVKLVACGLDRSAGIAVRARPRVEQRGGQSRAGEIGGEEKKRKEEGKEGKEREEDSEEGGVQCLKLRNFMNRETLEEEAAINLPLPIHNPEWGDIEHGGWASPNSPDLANVQYSAVLAELPNMIEAKAHTLGPSQQEQPDSPTTAPPSLDPNAAVLLQRPSSMSLRDYISHLASLGVLAAPPATVASFLTNYEHARFSTRPVSNQTFRELMQLFAEILRDMKPLDEALLDSASTTDESDTTSSNDAASQRRRKSTSTTSSALSARVHGESAEFRRPPFQTAPTTPKAKTKGAILPLQPLTVDTFAQTRLPFDASQASTPTPRSEASGEK